MRTLVLGGTLCLTACGLIACGGRLADTISPPGVASPDVYWALRMTDRAINLSVAAPTNALQLSATPVNAHRESLTGVTATPTFVSLNPEVTVSETGLLTAHAAGIGFRVVARLQLGALTHADTAIVNVTDTVPTNIPATLSIDPLPPDSAKWSFSLAAGKTITPVDADGNPITGVIFAYESSDPTIASAELSFDWFSGILGAVAPGVVTVTGSAYAYGTRLRDEAAFVIGYPTFQFLGVTEVPGSTGTATVTKFGLSDLVVGIGGQVVFNTTSMTRETGVTLEEVTGGTAPVCTGDLAALPPASFFAASCVFPSAGIYRYRALDNEASGTITVKEYLP